MEESRAPLRSTHVVGPTARERVEHDRLHLLHRSWCSVRVAGRGTSLGHKIALDELEQHAFEVSFDCSFPSRSVRRDYLPVLLACDRAWRSIIVHAVPSKSANVSWIPEQVCRDLKPLGRHGRVTLCGAPRTWAGKFSVFFKKWPRSGNSGHSPGTLSGW